MPSAQVVLEFPEMFWDNSLSYFGAALPGGPPSRGAASMFWNLRALTAANQLTAPGVGGAAAYAGEEGGRGEAARRRPEGAPEAVRGGSGAAAGRRGRNALAEGGVL